MIYVTVVGGFVYVAVILDAWSRRVVGYAISRSIDARLAVEVLNAAIKARPPAKNCVHHSDHESPYASADNCKVLADHQFEGSMSRRANTYENAKAEAS